MRAILLVSSALLAYTWIVYPAVVRALGALVRRGRRAPVAPSDRALPRVSVVIATADAADTIRARVANVLDTTYPLDRLEIVLAIDGVNGRTRPEELVYPSSPVVVVTGEAPGGKATTLNAGVRAATGDLLVMTDTHQRFEPRTISRLVEGIADSRFGAVSGALVKSLMPNATRRRTLGDMYWRYERGLRKAEAVLASAVGVTGAIYVTRRELWQPLPDGLILDDLYGPMRLVLAGHRVGFTEHARAEDTREFSAEQEYRRKVRTLTGNIQLCRWLPAVLVPVRNPIWIQFVSHKLLRLLTPYLMLLVVLGATVVVIGEFLALPRDRQLIVGAALLLLGACVLFVGRARRLVRSLVGWAIAMQAATVMAAVNGVRGRWTVWQR